MHVIDTGPRERVAAPGTRDDGYAPFPVVDDPAA